MLRPLCPADAVEEGMARGIDAHGQRYIVARESGTLYVFRNRCPHLGIPLEWQPDDFIDAETGLLRCATHGALFLLETGECVCGPCIGEFLPAVPSSINDDLLYVEVDA